MAVTAALTHTAGAVVTENRALEWPSQEGNERRRIFALFDIVELMKGHVGGGSGVWRIFKVRWVRKRASHLTGPSRIHT
jgi:hypothetical protein